MDSAELDKLVKSVIAIKKEAQYLASMGESFPALWRNAERVLAGVKMMELSLGPAMGDD